MSVTVLTKTYPSPPFCEKEILRYAGCKESGSEISALITACIAEVKEKLNYKVCYCSLPLKINGEICDFGAFSLKSENLAVNLKNCKSSVLFCATVGIEIDRLIARYGLISPAKALMFQAIGAERIEALCDTFCEDIKTEYSLCTRPRFSPGYGDLPLECQKDIFKLLLPEKRIGLTLTDSLLMSPTKSVTAIVGLSDDNKNTITNKCALCNKKDCTYRGAL